MKKMNKKNGFTLIELIIVMVILGIMAAVAVPRYLDSISNAEESAEDAVISVSDQGLHNMLTTLYMRAAEQSGLQTLLMLFQKSQLAILKMEMIADTDGEWTFISYDEVNGQITHQRADNSRYNWNYMAGTQVGDNAVPGYLEPRQELE